MDTGVYLTPRPQPALSFPPHTKTACPKLPLKIGETESQSSAWGQLEVGDTAFHGSGQPWVSLCVGKCQSWHSRELVVTLPFRVGWRDEPEDALGRGAVEGVSQIKEQGSVPVPWNVLAPTMAGFCRVAAQRG